MMRLINTLIILSLFSACSYLPDLDEVLPDQRKEYKKSEPLPDLEVPPDLTEGGNNNMYIPGETSLSSYNRGQNKAPEKPAADPMSDKQWISVSGSTNEIWSALRLFFIDKGYAVEEENAEKGTMQTAWSEPVNNAGFINRYKHTITAESGATDDVTVLYVNSDRQEQVGEEWVDQGKSMDAQKSIAGALNLYFNKNTPSTDTVISTPEQEIKQPAELQDAGNDKQLLAIPEEFSRAWRQVENALARAGLNVIDKNQSKGFFYINYYDGSAKKGWVSKLAFWKDDEPEEQIYVLSLTGVGDRSELVVLNEKGLWVEGDRAEKILTSVKDQYNNR